MKVMNTAGIRTTTGITTKRSERTHRTERVLGITLAVGSGVSMAAQGRINGQLGNEMHDSMLAAVISFGGGLLILLVALPLSSTMRAGVGKVREALREGRLKRWHCLGGLGGATFVAGQAVTVSVIGVAMFTVGVVAGQTISSLLVDRAGLGPTGAHHLSWPRVLGALLTLVAVVGSLSGGLGSSGASLWLLVLPFAGGAAMAVQQAINGRVNAVAGSSLTATLVNFGVGTTALVLGWLVSLAVRGGPVGFPSNPVLYLGGVVGIVFIALASLVVKWTGVLLLGLSAIAGQLIGSVLLDVFLPTHSGHPSTATLAGTSVALVAVVIAALPFGGRRRA
jgi:transporter family-2 protein